MTKNLGQMLKKTFLVALASTMIVGCGAFGKIKRDNALELSFEKGYEYQASPCDSPMAILKFPNKTLSDSWDCDIKNSQELNEKISKMKKDYFDFSGAYILNDKRKIIGEVYGIKDYLFSNPTVFIEKDNKFYIEAPKMEIKDGAGGDGSSGSGSGSDSGGSGSGGGGGQGGDI